MATTCFGPPPLPPNKRGSNSSSSNKDTLNKKNATMSNNSGGGKNSNLTSSTYMSFKDPLDEILVISSEDIVPDKHAHKKCHHHHKRKNSLKKCKHALNLSISKFTDDKSSKKNDAKCGNQMANGFENEKTYFLHSPEATENIPLKTFSEIFSKGCDDLTSCDEPLENGSYYATVKSNPFARPNSVGRSSFHTNSLTRSFRGFGELKLSLPRSSSEGNISVLVDKEVPLSLSPLGSRRGTGDAVPANNLAGQTRLNKCLRVLSGSWKNIFQLGGMSRSGKPAPQVKRVPPPAVPDAFGGVTTGPTGTQHRLSGTSFGSSQGYASSEDAGFLHPPDTPLAPIRDDHSDYGSTVSGASGGSGKSPGAMTGGSGGSGPAFTFPPPGPLTHKTAVFYHHQLALQEDQGIDMTQSPGRDSPGSSSGSAGSGSRHSSASLDSGRASGCPAAARCSLSSCSLSSDNTRMDRLLCQGLPDHDLIHAWLLELRFEEYTPLFIAAGYDLPTISRMTPEDLTAIGIKQPNHRKRLKTEIDNLRVPDNLPDYIPGSLEEWLRLLRLEEYGPALMAQGYTTVQDATQLTWEDLEDTGIVRLGHQKKFLLAIKRVKDIRSGKRSISMQAGDCCRLPHLHPGQTHEMLMTPSPLSAGDVTPGSYVHTTLHAYQHPWEVQQSRNISANYQQQIQFYQKNHPGVPFSSNSTGTDLVPIQIRQPRGKSLESLEDPSERVTHLTFSPENTQAYYCTHVNMNQPNLQTWRRSYDDGDITPTNEAVILSNYEGGGTLPRPRGLVKPRPVAKISATAKIVRENVVFQDINEKSPKYMMEGFQNVVYPIDKMGYPVQNQHISQMRQVYAVSPNMSKKMPPEPPKRQSSNSGIDQVAVQMEHTGFGKPFNNMGCFTHTYTPQTYVNTHQTTVEIHAEKHQDPGQKDARRTLPLSLPAYPSSDSLSNVSLLEGTGLGLEPPAPAPASPPRTWNQHSYPNCTLGNQSRNGSDASFKSSSSTESDSLPFANENAGTIKQNRSQIGTRPHTADFGRSNLPLSSLPPRHPNTPGSTQSSPGNQNSQDTSCENKTTPTTPKQSRSGIDLSAEPGDVLNDIGNMLANLTDELDAMLEEEKRQGLTDD